MKDQESELKNHKKDDDYLKKNDSIKNNPINSNQKSIFSTSTQPNIFGREQQMTICPFCKKKILTNVEQKFSYFSILISIILLIIFRFFSIILIIIVIPLTLNTIHFCPNCLNRVGLHTFYDTISLKDKIFTFQFLGLGIIITKKYLLGIFLFILSLIIFLFFLSKINIEPKILNENWNEFYAMCQAEPNRCRNYFLYQDVNWTGNVIKISYNENFFSRYRAFFIMKMDRSNKNDFSELMLDVTDKIYNKNKISIMELRRGDEIEFNCTIMIMPFDKSKKIRGNLINFKKTGKKIEIITKFNKLGRYATEENKEIEGKKLYKELPDIVSNEKKENELK